MTSARVILILGAGPRIGAAIALKFAGNGYKVALAARSVSEGRSAEGYLNLKLDLSDAKAIPAVFEVVEKSLGPPNIVVYNGARRLLTPPDDPLSASLETIAASRSIGFDGAYIAAQESLRVFQALPNATPTAFIFTGNALNQIAIPGVMPFAVGKVAAAMLIEYAANAYGQKGYRFYYTDERQPDGRASGQDIDGPAHAEMYWLLAAEEKQSRWLVTFTKNDGRKHFVGVDFDGNTRETYDQLYGRTEM